MGKGVGRGRRRRGKTKGADRTGDKECGGRKEVTRGEGRGGGGKVDSRRLKKVQTGEKVWLSILQI